MIIGIDLGTTNSEVAIVKNGKAIVLPIEGSVILPSVISLDAKGEVLVGKAAVNNELASPMHTIRRIKRKMGQEEQICLGEHLFTPPMIAGLILKKLKMTAESYLNEPVVKAVITVPAFFNEKQREATIEAAECAGLEVVRLINEPTAAAIAYSIGKKESEYCLVYDLGGGTFDVSIVHISGELMEVKASHGDVELGGADFDTLIAERVRQAFLREHEIDLTKDPIAWSRILRAAENAKICLSTEAKAQIREEFIADDASVPLHLHFDISRTEFEELIRPSIERSLVSIRKALAFASMEKSQIQRIILVGGATYTPLVAQMIEDEMGLTPQSWLNPSTIVAMGAAIEAANLDGQEVGPMMIDVTPHSLGIGCLGDDGYLFNSILIRRNNPIPCTASKVFYKYNQGQRQIEVNTYQGESEEIGQNKFLGKFILDDLEESSGMDVHIKFHLDRSGILHVSATDIATGKNAKHKLKKASDHRVKKANFSKLESIKLSASPNRDHLSLEDQEIWNSLDLSSKEEDSTETIHLIPSQDNNELLKKAHGLIDRGDLAEVDVAELNRELEYAEQGNPEAIDRLKNLVYFLE